MSFGNIIDRIAITLAPPRDNRPATRENPDFPRHLQAATGAVPTTPPAADPVGRFMLTGGWF